MTEMRFFVVLPRDGTPVLRRRKFYRTLRPWRFPLSHDAEVERDMMGASGK
jgi:hypothetical protein